MRRRCSNCRATQTTDPNSHGASGGARRVLTLQTIPAREKIVPPGGQVSLTLKNTCNRIAKLVFVETGALATVV